MSDNLISIYTISRGYRSCTVFHANKKTKRRVGTSTITPNAELPRKEKYQVIAEFLQERSGIDAPKYQPTKSETL